jgi:carbamoyltransferase
MYILGLNAFHGDSSACLFKDDKLIIAIEEERLRRVKHWAGFPTMAIEACLKKENISISDIDHITISKNPSTKIIKKIKHSLLKHRDLKTLLDRIVQANKIKSIKSLLAENFNINENDIKAKIHNIEHHRSHMASAFLASPFDNAAILSIDGFGDFSSTMIGYGHNCNIDVFDSVSYPHSIGAFYTAITQFLGFLNYGDEYKVMGLAPYGKPKYLEIMQDIVILTKNGLFKLNEKYFKYPKEGVSMSWNGGSPFIEIMYSDYLIEKLGKNRLKNEPITQLHMDIAASAQKMTEITIFHILNNLYEKTKTPNLCIAGGVAQNSVANGKIYLNTNFKNIYIPPAATDAGTSIGSALYFFNTIEKNPRIKPLFNANLGMNFSDLNIENTIKNNNLPYEKLSDQQINELVANELIKGNIIGWFKDKAEFGPRALGYRSILANPARDDAKEVLNIKIKKREPFRPFAPSILEDFTEQFFELNKPVPFMEKVFSIKPEKRKLIPAVTHVDGTGRLQTVSKKTNPKYYSMIETFYKKSGIPLVLNTSFNENEPIVNSPQEAIDTFLRTKMDILILENFVIKR